MPRYTISLPVVIHQGHDAAWPRLSEGPRVRETSVSVTFEAESFEKALTIFEDTLVSVVAEKLDAEVG